MTQRQSLTGDVSLILPEFDAPPQEPMALLHRWLDVAEEHGVREPGAASLATIGPNGPSTRTVLIKDFTDRGLLLTTSAASRKGVELTAEPACSVNFYWRETLQQVVVNGHARRSTPEHSNAEFDSRPAAARAVAIASAQSQPLESEAELRREAESVQASGHLVRPDHWHAWWIEPTEVEFWHGSSDRFHRRLVYQRDGVGQPWRALRLQP